jgi:hypothetical protein
MVLHSSEPELSACWPGLMFGYAFEMPGVEELEADPTGRYLLRLLG